MRIAVTGPQNTGKSTFIKDFSEAFPTFTVPTKTYRDVIKRHNLSVNRMTGVESQRLIRDFIAEQIRSSQSKTIFDRCLLDNYVYTAYAHRTGGIPEEFYNETRTMLYETASEIDLYLFIPSAVSIPLQNDHLRDIDPEYVDSINHLFIETLFSLVRDCGIRIATVSGTRDQRIEGARSALMAHGI